MKSSEEFQKLFARRWREKQSLIGAKKKKNREKGKKMGKKRIISAIMVVFVVLISMVALSGVAAGRTIGNVSVDAIIGETNLSFVNESGFSNLIEIFRSPD